MTAETTCRVAGCGRTVYAAGHCRSHYRRLREDGDPGGPIRVYRAGAEPVSMLGMSVPRRIAEALQEAAARAGVSVHSLVISILDRWAAKAGRQQK